MSFYVGELGGYKYAKWKRIFLPKVTFLKTQESGSMQFEEN